MKILSNRNFHRYLTALLPAAALALIGANPPPGGEERAAQKSAGLGVESQAPYGRYLTDAEGRALYLFEADEGVEGSACYGACAEAWPPLLTEEDQPRMTTQALDPQKVGTIERRDGSKQVTYGGWPLYYFVKDEGRGDVEGQDVHGFGGGWYLISPAGQKIEAEPTAALGQEKEQQEQSSP